MVRLVTRRNSCAIAYMHSSTNVDPSQIPKKWFERLILFKQNTLLIRVLVKNQYFFGYHKGVYKISDFASESTPVFWNKVGCLVKVFPFQNSWFFTKTLNKLSNKMSGSDHTCRFWDGSKMHIYAVYVNVHECMYSYSFQYGKVLWRVRLVCSPHNYWDFDSLDQVARKQFIVNSLLPALITYFLTGPEKNY